VPKRSKQLEDTVRAYLDLKKCQYISSKNQTVKCYKCNAFQQVRTQGFDFFVFYPVDMMAFIECKTGAGKMSPSQKKTQAMAEGCGIPYHIVIDTIDSLLEVM